MDFEIQETPEAREFRKDVRAWLATNIPKDFPRHADPSDYSYDDFLKTRDLGRKLGELGWLWPTAPKKYGGGGLSIELGIALEEELDQLDLSLPPYYDPGCRYGAPVLMVWGTEEQKTRLLPPMFKGEVAGWQLFTEPTSGSDLYSLKTTAVRDGNHYVLNGQKAFVGTAYDVDFFIILVRTDPKAERYKNLGWFQMPANLPGISRSPMRLLWTDGTGGASNIVTFENVRVPASCLIGGENNGFEVSKSWAELEHGIAGTIRRNRLITRLFAYVKQAQRGGVHLIDDPQVRSVLTDIFITSEVNRLLGLRNYWMSRTQQPVTYQGPQASYIRKMSGLETAKNILKILGPYALTSDPLWDLSDGHVEADQRHSICALHPGATEDIQRVIMARRIGIGRVEIEKPGKLTSLVTPVG